MDYLVKRLCRGDMYVKGKRQRTVAEIADRLDEYSVIALCNREELPLSLATSAGSATLRGDIYNPVWKALRAANGELVPFPVLSEAVASDGVTRTQLGEALFVLTGRGDIATTPKSATPDEDVTARLAPNRELCQPTRYVAGSSNLAAPGSAPTVTVGAVIRLGARKRV